MKKIVFILLAALFIISCQKKETEPVVTTIQQEVTFAAEWVDPGSMKSTSDDPYFPCLDLTPDYAFILIGTEEYYPKVFTLDNKLYTQAIKLDVPNSGQQSYTIGQFWLMHDNGAAGYGPEDQVVMATPTINSPFAPYVGDPVAFTFDVNAFAKAEIPIQVLCFQASSYSDFGFDWFAIDEIVVREQCFFGDICLNGDPYAPADYGVTGSPYGTNLGVDVPAIFEVTVQKLYQGVTTTYPSFNNLAWKGIGDPLCVQYPDDINKTGEVFYFDLNIMIKKADGTFAYVNFARLSCTDDGPFSVLPGDDNVIDFVLGTCVYTAANISFNWPVPPL